MSMDEERNERFVPNIGRFAKSSAIPNSYFLNKNFAQEVLPTNADIYLRNKVNKSSITKLAPDPITSGFIPVGYFLVTSLLPYIADKVAELRQRGVSRDTIIKVVKNNVKSKI